LEHVLLQIYNGKSKSYFFKDELRKDNFKFVKKKRDSYWEKKYKEGESNDDINSDVEYWNGKGLKTIILNPQNRRSNNYRDVFINNRKSIKGYYLCSYCGSILNKNTLTVDHIIPIDRTSKSRFLKWILKKFNIEDINDIKNLTPSCRRCNSRKGSKVGFSWIIRGLAGRYVFTWVLVWLFLLGVLIYLLIKFI